MKMGKSIQLTNLWREKSGADLRFLCNRNEGDAQRRKVKKEKANRIEHCVSILRYFIYTTSSHNWTSLPMSAFYIHCRTHKNGNQNEKREEKINEKPPSIRAWYTAQTRALSSYIQRSYPCVCAVYAFRAAVVHRIGHRIHRIAEDGWMDGCMDGLHKC